ncbi:hypothetical protein AB0M36_18220 [Actinoplanes sp. NPDC051346]|uniref:hypothetical protein n=1 Tax=Actinoplanes sp. NPDC051346 TaxID=3155048 RepID=UPI0034344845
MSVSSIGSGAALWGHVIAVGQPLDPQTQKAQANAQADLLQALRVAESGTVVAARVTDGRGIDVYA